MILNDIEVWNLQGFLAELLLKFLSKKLPETMLIRTIWLKKL